MVTEEKGGGGRNGARAVGAHSWADPGPGGRDVPGAGAAFGAGFKLKTNFRALAGK